MMSDTRKVIPIASVKPQGADDPELRSCSDAEPYALRVIGDSMAPEFRDGHILIIDPGLPAADGAYVVIDYEGETVFRQFRVDQAGRRFLKALNAAYPTVELVGEFRVRGVVVQRAGRRRKEHKKYY